MSKYYLLTSYLIPTFLGDADQGRYMAKQPMEERIKYFEKKKISLNNFTLVKLSSK